MTIFLFFLGFIVLIGGAEWLIEGATRLGRRLGISSLVIGLTVVAFGTSLPELVVNVFAGSSGEADLAVGNILGSNVANTFLILGATAAIRKLSVRRTMVYREVIFNVIASAVLLVLVADASLGDSGIIGLSRADGVILMTFFVLFLYYAFGRTTNISDVDEPAEFDFANVFLRLFGGAIGLYFGGLWIVEGASEIASSLGASESFIGLTIVAVGTSLPELAASVVAARRGNVDIAVGNVVGSNLFNILWVLGLSATLTPINFSSESVLNAGITLLVAGILFLSMAVGRYKHQVSRIEGFVFLGIYAIYVIYQGAMGFGV
jgi:cation:H+ antiporter